MTKNRDLTGLKIPEHIGFIMDGNGRWAKKRGLPRTLGHSAGAKTMKQTVYSCEKFGIKYVTVYAFSTENWNRPLEEVEGLMKLFGEYLDDSIMNFKNENKIFRCIGDISALSETLRNKIKEAEKITENNTGLTLNFAVNYGGRQEIVKAAKEIAEKCKNGEMDVSDINEQVFADHLYTKGQPDPDLIVRPSGEVRISNFMIWQGAYAEYLFSSDVLWPDFNEDELYKAICEYSKRDRRFGAIKEEAK